MNDHPGTSHQGDLDRGADTVESLSFSGKLDLYRRKMSEECEGASQRRAECSLGEWLAGPDGECPWGERYEQPTPGPEIFSEFMALFGRVTENMVSVCTEEDPWVF